jgi:hypothetical protein
MSFKNMLDTNRKLTTKPDPDLNKIRSYPKHGKETSRKPFRTVLILGFYVKKNLLHDL